MTPYLLILSTAICPAEPSRSDVLKDRRDRFPALVQLEERAQSAPAEFAAHALLRLAESEKLTDKLYREELVQQAFERASHGSLPIGLKSIQGSARPGSSAGITSESSRLGLDNVSLQSRAVLNMAAIDPRRARMLFEMIILPAPAKLRCQDGLVEDYSVYYAAAARIAQQLKGDESVRFVNDLVSRITSASQLAPAARILGSSNLAGFAADLQRVSGDDRSFTASLPEIKREMDRLAPGNPVLIAAYRQYLVQNLHATRCAESLDLDANASAAADAVAALNRFAGESAIPPDDAQATGKGDAYKPEQLLDPDFIAAQRARYQALMFGTGNRSLNADQKSASEWKQSFSDLLNEVAGMKPNPGESEGAFFFRKGGSLQMLLIAAPSGPERDRTFLQYVEFLQGSSFQKEKPAEWFAAVESLLSMIRSQKPSERDQWLQVLVNSGHPVLSLYAMIDQELSGRPDWAR